MNTVSVAAAQYPLDFLSSEAEYADKIANWVGEAAGEGAQLLVFPEYGAMELSSLAGKSAAGELALSIDAVSERLALQHDIHSALAAEYGVFIVSGSGPCRDPATGLVTNRVRLFSPRGNHGDYHKRIPTPWERSTWGIDAGPRDGLKVFDLGFAKVGLVICYDIEFPLIGRILAEAGAEIILAPSNTETEHGYWRVRTGCLARSLENQVYTVQSPTVGPAPWCPAVDMNVGAAGFFAPSDLGFPAGGCLAVGEFNKPGWVYAELDLQKTADLRASGNVRTFSHWQEQPGAASLPPATLLRLS